MVSGSWLLKAVRCLATSKVTTSRTKIHFDFFTFASVSTDLLVGGLTKKAVENRRPHKVGGVSRKAGFLCIQVHSIPLTTSSVTTSTRLQRADFVASKSFTKFGYNEHPVITSNFFCIFLLAVSGTQ